MTIGWSSEARRSLRAIRRYIAQDSEFYAARMVARIIERVERAAMAPGQGHSVRSKQIASYPRTQTSLSPSA